ncbi:MAG: substrate-binding domain-containing protein [Anaerolineales bacterium]|nr:substrate-binding domain-containing protein [Anaerolineales bacterium]
MMSLKKADNPRRTVGVLSAQLNRVWGGEFMAGVMDAAEQHDINLICFAGGVPTALETETKNKSYGFYDLLKHEQFDGILLAPDLAHGVAADEIRKFCETLAPLPIASFAVQAENVSSFVTDGEAAMRAVIRHLIEEHGYQKIAFVRGIRGQAEAEQRLRAYKDELRAHNLPFDETLIVDGDFSQESGRAAVRTLLDERGVRFQAVACANDRMAFGVMEVLEQRKIKVPDSIAVTGFDDVSEAQSMGIPLTTVHQPFYDAGVKAFEALVKKMDGGAIPPINLLEATFVIRWSCGCLPENIKQAVVLSKEVAQTGRLENKREAAMRALFSAAGVAENDAFKEQYRDVFGRAWDVFLASLNESDKSDAFLKMVQAFVEVLQRHGHDFADWQNVISTFRKYALGGITSPTARLKAENLFQQARMLIGELSQRMQAYRRLQVEQQEELLSNFSFSMAPAMSFAGIGEAISKNFPALGLEHWYVMFYGDDLIAPGSLSASPPETYRLLMQYDNGQFEMPHEKSAMATGRLVPRGKTPENHRYTAVVMPLSLASNRFGFMWTELGPKDWDIYVRVKNLISSALLRTMLAEQREQAQKEVERLLNESREGAVELARAKDVAEKAASQNAQLLGLEQARRQGAEALAHASRQLSSLTTVEKIPQQIGAQLRQILPHDRGILFIEDVNGAPQVRSYWGMPQEATAGNLKIKIGDLDFYQAVKQKGETVLINDLKTVKGWSQPEWLPADYAWMAAPLFSQNKAVGLLAVSRKAEPFSQDDGFMMTTYGVQATIALENARLYDEVTTMNQVMERMVAQRVEELNGAYKTLAKHDTNKSAFIQVAAHELRTPLTVIKGYLGILRADSGIQADNTLAQAIDGVGQGTERLQQIVNSMLDVARLDSQVINPHFESVSVGLSLRLVYKDYVKDIAARNLTFNLDEAVKDVPPVLADSELLKKAFDHVIVNAIKYTPDGGVISVSATVVEDAKMGKCAEIQIKDSGIGIDREHHQIIFEKLYQLGKVELHSSSRTNYKGGGAGLGLAIASGIIKALHGTIWVESAGHDEEKFSGSTFFIRLPLVK